MARALRLVCALALLSSGCLSETPRADVAEELELYEARLSAMSPAQACQELLELCESTAKGCLAHDLFCTAISPEPDVCAELEELCLGGSQTACGARERKCGGTSDPDLPADSGTSSVADERLCGDGLQNGTETSVDCGPSCALCPGVPAPVPNPMLLAYAAFASSLDLALLNQETATPVPNVVEIGANATATPIAVSLAKRGVLPAAHVILVPQASDAVWSALKCLDASSAIDPCVKYNVGAWKKAFDAGTGFPGGFKAISIDEISLLVSDETSRKTQIGLKTLAQIHRELPELRIFLWSGACTTSGTTRCSVATLTTIAQNVDRLMVERYLGERSTDVASEARFKIFDTAINAIKSACSGAACSSIIPKTFLGVGASDTEYGAYDKEPGVDFPNFIDAQIHYIRNAPTLASLPGLGVFSYARTRPETQAWINRLFKHYYLDGQTTLLGDGAVILQSVANPSFESAGGWTLTPGASGRVEYLKTSATEVQVVTSPVTATSPRVPHGAQVLFMKRGTTPNRAVQSIAVSPLQMFHLDVYAKNQTGASSYALAANAQVEIVDGAQHDLAIYRETPKLVRSNPSKITYAAKDHNWTRFRLEGKVPPGVTSISLLLSDKPAKAGEITLWDVVELETLKAGSLAAGLGGRAASADLIKNAGFEQDSLFWREYREAGGTLTGKVVTSPGAKSGAKNLLLQTDRGADSWLQELLLQNPYRYRVSGWVYLPSPGAQASLVVEARERTGTAATEFVARAKPTVAGEWQQVQVEFELAWKLEPMVTLVVRVEGTSAKAYFDELRVTKLTP